MELNRLITLKAISKHGKDRINQFGNKWIIKKVANKVGFDSRLGIWLGLEASNGKDFRWVKDNGDNNFLIVE